MQIEVRIDLDCQETKIIIVTSEVNDEINEIIKKLEDVHPKIITGFKDDTIKILESDEIYRIYASGGKVFVETDKEVYTLNLRLYEVEQRTDNRVFLRISNSEIVNLKKVRSFDLSFTGTICVKMLNGTITYASRRYVSRIKKILGI
ncbi:MAG TPA: LytTR family DNA-binding domain-containing protein [Erysipelotrichaceae bacterium]|nr:LytTR family DNA-binding domain-containing protein [Erysipelotrichaceae bacterium]